jgi:hypothetical protein
MKEKESHSVDALHFTHRLFDFFLSSFFNKTQLAQLHLPGTNKTKRTAAQGLEPIDTHIPTLTTHTFHTLT